MTTGHEARERKVVRRFSGLARVPSLEIVKWTPFVGPGGFEIKV